MLESGETPFSYFSPIEIFKAPVKNRIQYGEIKALSHFSAAFGVFPLLAPHKKTGDDKPENRKKKRGKIDGNT